MHIFIKMSWVTPNYIVRALGTERLSTRDIKNKMKEIGDDETYNVVNKHLRKMFRRKQLFRGREGRCYVYWNPLAKGEIE